MFRAGFDAEPAGMTGVAIDDEGLSTAVDLHLDPGRPRQRAEFFGRQLAQLEHVEGADLRAVTGAFASCVGNDGHDTPGFVGA